jgi:hypothetical protein
MNSATLLAADRGTRLKVVLFALIASMAMSHVMPARPAAVLQQRAGAS